MLSEIYYDRFSCILCRNHTALTGYGSMFFEHRNLKTWQLWHMGTTSASNKRWCLVVCKRWMQEAFACRWKPEAVVQECGKIWQGGSCIIYYPFKTYATLCGMKIERLAGSCVHDFNGSIEIQSDVAQKVKYVSRVKKG